MQKSNTLQHKWCEELAFKSATLAFNSYKAEIPKLSWAPFLEGS